MPELQLQQKTSYEFIEEQPRLAEIARERDQTNLAAKPNLGGGSVSAAIIDRDDFSVRVRLLRFPQHGFDVFILVVKRYDDTDIHRG